MEFRWDASPKQDRFDHVSGQRTMKAVVTAGNGGYEELQCRVVPVPELGPGEVLLQVLAAGINNTEINTRLGWYSSSVTTGTADAANAEAVESTDKGDGGWNEATPFPFIQGTDCCGRIVAVSSGGDESSIGARVLVRPCMRSSGFESMDSVWMGSDFDGAFAQYVKVPADEVFPVQCDWSDAELGTIPCAYGTAENMLYRGRVCRGEHVLVAGASGGVGSAVVQLAKRRGAIVTAITTKSKRAQLMSIGADQVIDRDELPDGFGECVADVVIDNVAGQNFGCMLNALKRGGRYVFSGAIAGPLVTLDMRTLYLKDLTLIGCTAWDEPVFRNLISYIERGELRPAPRGKDFSARTHRGRAARVPPEEARWQLRSDSAAAE